MEEPVPSSEPGSEPVPSSEPEPLPDKFKLRVLIGKGTTGLVYEAESEAESENPWVVIKVFKNPEDGRKEAKLLCQLKDVPGIIAVLGTQEKADGTFWLILERMNCDLLYFIEKCLHPRKESPGQPLSLLGLQKLFQALCTGLEGIHQKNIIHLDLKPENILLRERELEEEYMEAYYCDFANSRSFETGTKIALQTPLHVSRWYRPPEIMLVTWNLLPVCDVWSLGCIFFEIITGKPLLPSRSEDVLEYLQLVQEITGEIRLPLDYDSKIAKHFFNDDGKLKAQAPVRKRMRPDLGLDLASAKEMCQMERILRNELTAMAKPEQNQMANPEQNPIIDSLMDLFRRMLDFNPKTRISAKCALAHPFFSFKI
jgi:serine/threonine protein kinase